MDIVNLFFKADISDLNKAQKTLGDVKNASAATQSKTDAFSKALEGLGPAGATAGRAVSMVLGPTVLLASAAVATAGALAKLALNVADVGDAMNDMANRTNIATERLTLYDAMAKMAGSSAEELVSSAERLGTKLARQDEESGRAASALKELGISTKDANGEQKSMLQLQEDIILAVDKATNKSKAEGAALQLLGNDYYKLRTAVRETAEQKSEMYDYMQRTGSLVTTKLAKDSDSLNDSISKLKLAFTGMGNSIGSIVIPILDTVIQKIGAIAADAAALIRKYTGNSTASEVASDRQNSIQSRIDYLEQSKGGLRYRNPTDKAKIDAELDRLKTELSAAQSDAILARRSMDQQKSDAIDGKAGDGNRPAGRAGGGKTTPDGRRLGADEIYRMQEEDRQRHAEEQAKIDEVNKQEALAREQSFADARKKIEQDFFASVTLMEDEYIRQGQEAFKQRQEQWTKDHETLMQVGQMAFNSLSQSLMNLTVGGEFSARKFFTSMLQGFAQIITQLLVITPLMEGFKKSFATSSGGGWGGLLGNIFSSMPKFAAGGDPPVGRVSLVGERGPELFVPKTAGTIVPNHALGGGEQNVYLTVNVEGGGNAEETGSIVGAKVIQMVRGVVKQELASNARQQRYAV